MSTVSEDARTYYPPPESQGGWRWLQKPEEIRGIGGMDPVKLQLACEWNEQFDSSSSVVIIHNGYLVAEWYDNWTLTATRFDIWSCTKSFTGTAYGLLFEESRQGRLPGGRSVDLETLAYPLIPDGFPLSDPRKERITVRHLLTMTSGIPGEETGIAAIPTQTGIGPFEAALGRAPLYYRRWPAPRWAATLSTDPGTHWDYSDPAIAHLALIFHHVTGQEMSAFMQERVCSPIGIESLSWDRQGGGAGLIGPHTNAHTGIHVSARELARFGYLMLRQGMWNGQQILPAWWIELATHSSQEFNPSYGYTWWVNAPGTQWPGIPRDAFAASGYRCNRCYVIPSLDLVVVRIGSGPPSWDESAFVSTVADAVIAE